MILSLRFDVLVCLLASCGSTRVAQPVESRAAPAAETVSPPVGDSNEFLDVNDALGGPVLEFASNLASNAGGRSIGVLPLATYRVERREPHVTDLSEDIANRVAQELRSQGMSGRVRDLDGMRLRLTRANIPPDLLVSPEALGTKGLRLGIDVIVFGSIRENRRVGVQDSLSIRLVAYDLLNQTTLATRNIEVDRGIADRRLWTLLGRNSLWDTKSWDTPLVERKFDAEISFMAESMATDLAASLAQSGVEYKAAYMAPTETQVFNGALARLRAAQKQWADVFANRTERIAAGEEIDLWGPVILDAYEFPSAEEASEYLTRLRANLQASSAAVFGRSVSSAIAGELQRRVSSLGLRVNDIGFTNWSDTALVEGELATGGLVTSLVARRALAANGIDLVIAPKLERLGNSLLLRVEAYDIERQMLVASSFWPVDEKYFDSLAEQLGVGETEYMRSGVSAVKLQNSWVDTFEEVVSGVVSVLVPTGEGVKGGTGFLVDDRGFFVTNHHVINGATGDLLVSFRNGDSLLANVVGSDEFLDVAVLKVEGFQGQRHVFEFSSDVAIGEAVAIVGNPKGTNGWVLATGHLSSMTETARTSGNRPSYMYNCPTRGGNSGSPVFTMAGSVIAVHSHGIAGEVQGGTDSSRLFSEMPGFALGAPAKDAAKFVDRILAKY